MATFLIFLCAVSETLAPLRTLADKNGIPIPITLGRERKHFH